MATTKDLRSSFKEQGSELPRRSFDATLVTLTSETTTGWISKQFYGALNFSWSQDYPGVTATVKGRYLDDTTPPAVPVGEHAVGDSGAVPLSIDLNQGADGSSIALDAAAACDQVKVDFSAPVSGDFVFGKAA